MRWIVLISGFFIASSGCDKDSTTPCRNGGYSFLANSEWVPRQVTYQIGDTLRLSSKFSKSLTDQEYPNQQVDYNNATGVGGTLTIYALDTITRSFLGAINQFNFMEVVGYISEGDIVPLEVKNMSYAELTDSFKFNLNIVAREKGIFVFYVSDLYCRGLKGKDCTNAGFSNPIVNPERGIALFEYAMNRPPASQFEAERMYCFRVE